MEMNSQEIENNPKYVKLLAKRMHLRMRGGGGVESAIHDADAILNIDPKNVEALNFRANVRMLSGDLSQAISDVNAVLKIDPDNVSAGLTKASCFNL